jgi:hypothetical protein
MIDRGTLLSQKDTPCATHRHRLTTSTPSVFPNASAILPIRPPRRAAERCCGVQHIGTQALFAFLTAYLSNSQISSTISPKSTFWPAQAPSAHGFAIPTADWHMPLLLYFFPCLFFHKTYQLAIGHAGSGGLEREVFDIPARH